MATHAINIRAMNELSEKVRALPPIPQLIVLCHPANAQMLRELGEVRVGPFALYSGFPIHENSAIPRYRKRWEFPKRPFVEYEPSDEPWCRYFGFGREVETNEPLFYVFDARKLFGPFRPHSEFLGT